MKKNTSVQLFILLFSFSALAFSVYRYVHPSIQYLQNKVLHAAGLPAVTRTRNIIIQEEKFSEAVPFYTPDNDANVQVPPGHQSKASPTTLDTKQLHSSKLPYDTQTQAHGEHPPAQDKQLFLYLTQTEECLPQQLREALGDQADCQCDVAVLSYKENCTDSFLPHVRYIFNQSTTWGTGRNLLFYTFIHNTSNAYLYYIMIDDDVDMRWLKEGNKGNPWREIEELIAHVQPAVAGLPMSFSEYSKYAQREKSNCSLGEGYATAAWFDGCFTAFHYKAIEHLLPYWSAMDNISWWAPHGHFLVRSDVLFSGQVVISKRVMILNSKHREYPRHVGTTKEGFYPKILPKAVKNAFAKSLPEKCPNAPVVQGWKEHGKRYATDLSPTLCMPPPPPKQTITPYRNFVCN